jgi:hypothetical protein
MPAEAATISTGSAAEAPPTHAGNVRLRTLSDMDRRTRAYQKAASFRDELIADLGGEGRVSAAQRGLVDVAAVTQAVLEDLAVQCLPGGRDDLLPLFFTGQNAQRRNLQTLGMERCAKGAAASLADFLDRNPRELARRVAVTLDQGGNGPGRFARRVGGGRDGPPRHPSSHKSTTPLPSQRRRFRSCWRLNLTR